MSAVQVAKLLQVKVAGQGGKTPGAALPVLKVWDPELQEEKAPPPEHEQLMSLSSMHCPVTSVSVTEEGVPDDLQLPHPTSWIPPTESIINSANFCATPVLPNFFIISIFS